MMLFWVLVIGSCSDRSESVSDKTVVRGVIERPASGYVYFYSYADSGDYFMGITSALDSALPDAKGYFVLEPEVKQYCYFSLFYDRKDLVTNLVVHENDRLDIDFIGEQRVPKIVSKGNTSAFNTYLLKFTDEFYHKPAVKKEYYVSSNYMEVGPYAEYTDKRRLAMMDYYSNYFKGEQLDPLFLDYTLLAIKYEFGCDRLMYLWKKRMKGELIFPDSSYLAFVNPEYLSNEDALLSPSYIRFVNLYIKEMYERKLESGEFLKVGSTPIIANVEKYKIASSLLNGKVRDVVYYNLAFNELKAMNSLSDSLHSSRQSPELVLKAFEQKYGLKD
jgi:hypothetical protein